MLCLEGEAEMARRLKEGARQRGEGCPEAEKWQETDRSICHCGVMRRGYKIKRGMNVRIGTRGEI